MSKKKFNKIQPPHENSRILPTESKRVQGISFSFKYLQTDHSKFFCKEQETAYFLTFLERLKNLSGWTTQELIVDRSRAIRCHPIDWNQTSEPCFGIPNEEQLVDTPYQLSLTANAYGRIHGFFIENIFYIVWLDPDHLLYPS